MSDSLRDQLIAAGFDAPKKNERKKTSHKARKKKKSAQVKAKQNSATTRNANAGKSNTAASEDAALERKKLKAQIKELIDNTKLDNWKGEIAYRYTVEKRIRELYVNESIHKKLTDREASITRLNGDTYLVPQTTATEIIKINPQWSVFNTDKDKEPDTTVEDDYADFQVPDDLKW